MSEYEVTLINPDGSRSVESVSLAETALGMQERWEQRGEGYRAEVRTVAGSDVRSLIAA